MLSLPFKIKVMKKILFFTMLVLSTIGYAQDGKIQGQILDGENNNEALPFANIKILEKNLTATTNLEGEFELALADGTYTLFINFVGYEPITVPSVTVNEGEIFTINEKLYAKKVQLPRDLALNP